MVELSEGVRRTATLFDQVAASYESVGVPWFAPIAAKLVDEIDPHAGEHVIDIGCGRGVAIPALSAAVGRTGRVVGIDVSTKMLAGARHGVELRGLHNVELYAMDAMAPDLAAASFSAAVASLVLPFVPDPAAALSAWHHLLVPMGRIGITTFAERDDDWVELDGLFGPYLPPGFADIRTTGARGPFASDDGVAGLLTAAGFQDVRTVRWPLPVTFADPSQWRAWSMSHGQRAMWNNVPESDREGVQERATVILERRRGAGNPITMTQTVRMTVGYRRL